MGRFGVWGCLDGVFGTARRRLYDANLLIALLSAFSLTFASVEAHAQSMLAAAPPNNLAPDQNGVDVMSAQVGFTKTELTVGRGVGALAYQRTFIGKGWRDNLTGTIDNSVVSTVYNVSLGGTNEQFTLSGGTFTSSAAMGSTLTLSGSTYTYTLRDGTVITFSTAYAQSPPKGPVQANQAQITSITTPTGVVTNFTYATATVSGVSYFRLQSVNNNLGYQLKLKYSLDGPTSSTQIPAWQTITEVMGINNAVDYCSPTSDGYTGCTFTVSWPSVTYAVSGAQQTVTDALSRITTYNWGTSGMTSAQQPSGLTMTYGYTSGQLTSASNGTGSWSYAVTCCLLGIQNVTIGDPMGNSSTIGSNSTPNVVSSTDSLSNTTNYTYDANGRLTQVQMPEGNEVQYTLDGRGNVTQIVQVPKSGSGLSNITTSASYDSTCTNPVKCNKPNSVTDGNGNTTSYTYDATYGVVTKVDPPAPSSGATQPEMRLSYTSLYAYYKNSSGSIVAAPTSVRMLTGTSECQTTAASSCPGTSDEATATITYGSTGVANNLAPTQISEGDGTGSLTASVSMTYDSVGNLATRQGPLGSSQTSTFVYDADREIVGVISPNPGEAGLSYPSVRYTYGNTTSANDGLITKIEHGTVSSPSSWSGFSTLLQTAIGYDSLDRESYEIQASSGGTEQSVTQFAYDAGNRTTCIAVRMNTSLFGSLPSTPLGTLPSSACTLSTAGSYGNDRVTAYAYDGDSRVTSTTIARGDSTQAAYATNTYSSNGLTKTVMDGNSNLTTYTYDGFDRLSQINYPTSTLGSGTSSTTDYEGYTYDANGNALSDRRRDGNSLNYCYDALNRTIRKDFPGSTSTNCALTSLTGSVFYGYDLLSRMTYANYSSTTGTGISYAWDALNRVTTETSPSGAMSYQYDLAGNRTRITWPDSFYAGYVYDYLNRIQTINENGATSGVGVLATYSFDDLGHRTGVTDGSGASSTWSWDSATGRLSSLAHSFTNSSANVTFSYSYSPDNQLTSRTVSNSSYVSHPAATITEGYNASGVSSYSSVGGTTYSYDSRQNLTSDGTRTFTYDSENRLLTGSAPTSVTLTYDPTGRLQTSAAGGTTTTFVYAGDRLATEYNGSTLLRRYVPAPGVDEPLIWYEGSGTTSRKWLHDDELGSIVAWSDSSGNQQAAYGYGPNGEPSSWSGPSTSPRYRYTGQLVIPESQLYYYKSRAYDPVLGRFLQTDPVGYASDINPYTYVGNDSTNETDPTGLIINDDPSLCAEGGPCPPPLPPDPDTSGVAELVVWGCGFTTNPECVDPDLPNYAKGIILDWGPHILQRYSFSISPTAIAVATAPSVSQVVVTAQKRQRCDTSKQSCAPVRPPVFMAVGANANDNVMHPLCRAATTICELNMAKRYRDPVWAQETRDRAQRACLQAGRDCQNHARRMFEFGFIVFPDGTTILQEGPILIMPIIGRP